MRPASANGWFHSLRSVSHLQRRCYSSHPPFCLQMLIRVSLGSKSCILQLALKGDIPQDSHSIKTDISTNAYTRKSLPYSFKTLNAGASYFPGSKWKTGLRQYPMFAEYTNGQSSDGLNGLSDTGLTMRAFLPISNPQTRSSIHSYEGLSTVVDARVACVRPNITNLWLQINSTDRLYEDLILSGDMFIPTDLLDTAASSRIFPTTPARYQKELSWTIQLASCIIIRTGNSASVNFGEGQAFLSLNFLRLISPIGGTWKSTIICS
jgi:hypothetical protein